MKNSESFNQRYMIAIQNAVHVTAVNLIGGPHALSNGPIDLLINTITSAPEDISTIREIAQRIASADDLGKYLSYITKCARPTIGSVRLLIEVLKSIAPSHPLSCWAEYPLVSWLSAYDTRLRAGNLELRNAQVAHSALEATVAIFIDVENPVTGWIACKVVGVSPVALTYLCPVAIHANLRDGVIRLVDRRLEDVADVALLDEKPPFSRHVRPILRPSLAVLLSVPENVTDHFLKTE